MFRKLLIANRGEIAIRIARSAADLGIATVAMFSTDDVTSLHVRKADEAHPLGKAGPAAYLDIEGIIALAKAAGCDAIHPGYGFVSENARFARRAEEESLTFGEARATALKACRESRDAIKDPSLTSLCVVIGSFQDQCFSIAWDPKAGTPGVGWAISPTKQEADGKALSNCRATAGAGRRDYCVVDRAEGYVPGVASSTGSRDYCDGSAK
jgi:Biotin carboxylase, N-terminal domain/Domain of unknown function (DUF4189)